MTGHPPEARSASRRSLPAAGDAEDGDGVTKRPPGTLTVTAADGIPQRIRWRDRTYLVQTVLARWIESGAWWQALAGRVGVTGREAAPLSCTVWRVEVRGAGGSLVLDLAHEGGSDTWSLVRLAD